MPCFAFEGPGGVAGQPGGVPPGRDSSISGGAGTLLTPGPGGIAIALAAAAEAGRFDELRREMFANQPPEHSGGFTTQDLLDLGSRVGLTSAEYVAAVQEGRYESWVREIDEVFEEQDPRGTPFAVLDGQPVGSETLSDAQRLGALIRS